MVAIVEIVVIVVVELVVVVRQLKPCRTPVVKVVLHSVHAVGDA